jgi:putative DNA primase/helicase
MSDNVIDIRDQVAARVQEEVEHIPPEGDDKLDSGGPDDPEFILRCLNNNERGDGILFATMHRGKFVYVKSRDEKAKAWFYWSGHHWEIDKADFSHAAVESVAMLYQRESLNLNPEISESREKLSEANGLVKHYNALKKELIKDDATPAEFTACDREGRKAEEDSALYSTKVKKLTSQQKKLIGRADRLRALKGAKNCLEWSHKLGKEGLFIYGDEVDQKPMLLACDNGVVDLETGDLIDGNPLDYLVRAIPVQFKGIDEPAPVWERFISEIHQADEFLIEFIHRFFGYCLTGRDPEQVYACFIGEGANGKGIMFEILREILGDLSWSINPEVLLDSKIQKSPDGPSPSTMSLQGRRLVVASETDEGRKISGGQIKRFTGSDTLTGRNLFDKYDTNFSPTHKLVLYTNHAPTGLTADFALLRRLLYIYYPLRYVDDIEYWSKLEPNNAHLYRKKDGELKKKLRAEKSGILAWLVRGCLKWQDPENGGLQVPDSIRAAVEEIRKKEDYIGQFIDDIIKEGDPGTGISFSAVYDRFKKWYGDKHGSGEKGDDKYMVKKRKFGETLRKKGYYLPDSRSTSGKQYIGGITFDDVTYDQLISLPDISEGDGGL